MNLSPKTQFNLTLGGIFTSAVALIATTVIVLQFFGVVQIGGNRAGAQTTMTVDCKTVEQCKEIVIQQDLEQFITRKEMVLIVDNTDTKLELLKTTTEDIKKILEEMRKKSSN